MTFEKELPRSDGAPTFDQQLFRSLARVEQGAEDAGERYPPEIAAELSHGLQALAGVDRAISVFGSSRTPPTHPHYALVRAVANELGCAGYAIVTGGGPGLMEAANRGAKDAGALSIGLNLEFPVREVPNEHLDLLLRFRHFFSRKVMFLRYASAYAIAPGGFGTLDELFEVLTLVQTDTVASRPVLLIGEGEWDGLLSWLEGNAVADGRIDASDLGLLHLVGSPEHAVEIVQEARRGA
jgi:uncharacterized protein (TIGR00730 family)